MASYSSKKNLQPKRCHKFHYLPGTVLCVYLTEYYNLLRKYNLPFKNQQSLSWLKYSDLLRFQTTRLSQFHLETLSERRRNIDSRSQLLKQSIAVFDSKVRESLQFCPSRDQAEISTQWSQPYLEEEKMTHISFKVEIPKTQIPCYLLLLDVVIQL